MTSSNRWAPLLALALLPACTTNPDPADTQADSSEATSTSETGETGETGEDESFPDCVPRDSPAPEAYGWLGSDSWEQVVLPDDQYLLERALCIFDSAEHIPGDADSPAFVNLWMSCVRELDQATYDDVVVLVSGDSDGSEVEAMLMAEVEVEFAFEHVSWFAIEGGNHTVMTLRSVEGELLFAAANDSFMATSVDDQNRPRWEVDPVGVPETDPAAVASWLEPFAGFGLVDDLCPVIDDPEANFVFDASRRFALRVQDDSGTRLLFDGTSEALVMDGRAFRASVSDAHADWRFDETELAQGQLSMMLIRTDWLP